VLCRSRSTFNSTDHYRVTELLLGGELAMSTKPKVLIAGAGLGGLTAALACLKYGFDVEVFEQASALGEVGAGVQIGPNGFKVVDALGLKDRVLESCFCPSRREMRVWNTGYCSSAPMRTEAIIARYGHPLVNMHRADLHAILANAVQAAAPTAVHVDARVAGYFQSGDEVTLKLEDGRTFSGDVLIGADGLHSVIRAQLVGPSKAQFTGGLAWRGLIPMEQLPEEARLDANQAWVGPTGHIAVYPVRRGELVNVVAHADRDDWQVESWTVLGTREEMAGDFKGWHSTIQTLINGIESHYKWALFLHPTLPNWSKGRVSLLGDACHPTLPYLASGANMAIEDAYVLARCLRHAAPDYAAGLKRYEELRIPRTTRIVNASAANLPRYRHPDLGKPDTARTYVDREMLEQQEDRTWLYSYDATSVAL
jgi:salicylate hydroxylase